MECGDVLLARLDISGELAAISSRDALCAYRARQDYRYIGVCVRAAANLSASRNISVDYAVMEPATQSRFGGIRTRKRADRPAARVCVIPARVGWSDIGSWAAVYELLASNAGANVSAGPFFSNDASGNYFWSPKKFVAAIGVREMLLVETDDAILLCPRERSQDVGRIVKWLEERKLKHLL